MKLAFFGDVVGRSGREAVKRHLPGLKGHLGLDAVVINAENAAGGFGITRATVFNVNGYQLLVINVLGSVFMDPLDNAFHAVDRELEAAPLGAVADAVLVDVHAEATSEKNAMGYFCDGRASLVVGTHQHVPTGDARILPNGTAYQTDAGMCGDYNSVIGMEVEEPIRRFTTKMRGGRFTPASGPGTLCGVYVETGSNGLATRIESIRIGGQLATNIPELN